MAWAEESLVSNVLPSLKDSKNPNFLNISDAAAFIISHKRMMNKVP